MSYKECRAHEKKNQFLKNIIFLQYYNQRAKNFTIHKPSQAI